MPSFTYKAVAQGGKHVTGVLTAENYAVALRQLDELSLFPVQVREGTEQGTVPFSRGRRKKVKGAHLTTFYSQLADLLKAGVPLMRALDVLGKQTSTGSLTLTVRELREDVAGGMALGEAMAKHPNAFSPLHASMVRAGEQGGFLEDVLARIAIFSEKQDELRNKLLGAMVYPIILVLISITIFVLLLVVVVPKLGDHLRPETFNIMTHIVFGVSNTLKNHYIGIIVGVLVVIAALSSYLKTEGGKKAMDRFKLRGPVLGKVFTMVAICRFCRILGTMLHNGVPILQALRISKDSAGSNMLAETIDKAAESVKKGAALSAPLGDSGLFPQTILDMIAVAEESNNLETVLVQIAETNEARTARSIDLAVRILEPILLMFMAGIVFCIAVALLLPILTMGTGVQ